MGRRQTGQWSQAQNLTILTLVVLGCIGPSLHYIQGSYALYAGLYQPNFSLAGSKYELTCNFDPLVSVCSASKIASTRHLAGDENKLI